MHGVPRPSSVAATTLQALLPAAGAGAALTGADIDRHRHDDEQCRRCARATCSRRRPARTRTARRTPTQARNAGAVAVLTDRAGLAFVPGLPAIVVPDVRAAVGPVAAAVYGRPSAAMDVIGITGTSGKTTTTFFVRAGLLAAGRACGLIGTVATMIGEEAVKTGFTTPEAPEVQALLAVMRERGIDSVSMEVSSHALALGRAGGIEFAVGAFTNLSQDHLDFHPDMADYFAAKARLVRRALARGGGVRGRRVGGTDGGCSRSGRAHRQHVPGRATGRCPTSAPTRRGTPRSARTDRACPLRRVAPCQARST